MAMFHPKPLTRAVRNNTAGVTSKDRTVGGSRPDGSGASTGSTDVAGGGVPVGFIGMYSGSFVDIPSNWKVCDGSGGTPDLRDRFILGTGTEAAIGTTGGAVTHTHAAGTLAVAAHTTAADTAVAGAETRVTTATHVVSGATAATDGRPPYYVLAFIRRMS